VPLLAALGLLCAGVPGAQAQLLPRVRGAAPPASAASAAPETVAPAVDLTADRVTAKLDAEAVATGRVEMRRADTQVQADELRYDRRTDRARATGHVRLSRGDDWFTGSTMDITLKSIQGELTAAHYEIGRTGSGGTASRLVIADKDHATAYDATYTSCRREDGDTPDWVLTGDRIDIDAARNEGTAHGAVLHFLGVPILALPTMTFPTSAERRSGWLPPAGDFDNRNGLQLGVPYYWNIASNVDATLTPQLMSKSGAALGTEVRYLTGRDLGQISVFGLPKDQVSAISRWSAQVAHDGESEGGGLVYGLRWLHASDNDFWKDYVQHLPSLTTRLLPLDGQATARWDLGSVDGQIATYARVQRWQTLQESADLTSIIAVPYQRTPQVGMRGSAGVGALRGSVEAEYNRFDLAGPVIGRYLRNADGTPVTDAGNQPLAPRSGGQRVHLTTALEGDFGNSWGRLTPRLSVNAAGYRTDEAMSDGRISASRVVPTFSLDSQLAFEKQTELFGHRFTQTLEPRVLYVLTPYRWQDTLPMYDTAAKDFNTLSIYSDNAFSGIDRISDANQLTAGATTRFNGLADGRELLRLGVAERFLFHDQRITPEGTPQTHNFSDLLVWGTSTLSDQWTLDGTVQFNPSTASTSRAVVSARYHPGPYKTLSLTYRFASGSIEQYEVGGQWPIFQRSRPKGTSATSGRCGGTLYAVGRVNYSTLDTRVNYAVGGLEYDAGCWVGSLVVERQSTGRNEDRTHLMLQLELVGLSNLGAGSLKVLKDNIPGYQPLRDDSTTATPRATTP
jgi:LPS-assembly protein